MLMQLRKNCNHPDIITADYDQSAEYPPAAELVAQAGKMQMLERLLLRLKKGGHKVLIFSQVRPPPRRGAVWRPSAAVFPRARQPHELLKRCTYVWECHSRDLPHQYPCL